LNADLGLLTSLYGVASRLPRCAHCASIAVAAVAVLVASGEMRAQTAKPTPGDPRITPGQVIDGWTGKPIPCRCRYKDRTYNLGDIICMYTPRGTVFTRCELFLNNTSWMPTDEPCIISKLMGDSTSGEATEPLP